MGHDQARASLARQTTAERTWQALAWEARARVAMARVDDHRARISIDNARLAMEGSEIPLAAWRERLREAFLEAPSVRAIIESSRPSR